MIPACLRAQTSLSGPASASPALRGQSCLRRPTQARNHTNNRQCGSLQQLLHAVDEALAGQISSRWGWQLAGGRCTGCADAGMELSAAHAEVHGSRRRRTNSDKGHAGRCQQVPWRQSTLPDLRVALEEEMRLGAVDSDCCQQPIGGRRPHVDPRPIRPEQVGGERRESGAELAFLQEVTCMTCAPRYQVSKRASLERVCSRQVGV